MKSFVNDEHSNQVDKIISKYADWRGEKLRVIRELIKKANPSIIEEVKWKTPSNPDGIPVWSYCGIICTEETYKKHLRISFAKGPLLKDPKRLINSYRAVLIHEGDEIDKASFKNLVKDAAELNQKTKRKAK